MSISPIQIPSVPSIEGGAKSSAVQGTDVGGGFGKALSEARDLESSAATASEKFANGDQTVGIHEVMIATEKASIALRFATTLKNKAVEAYRELMNTQV